jgi:hypothetical protein
VASDLRLIALRQQPDHFCSGQSIIEQFERRGTLNGQRNDRPRKNNKSTHWQDR